MRRYETIVIIDPDLNEDDRTALIERIKEIIPQQEGVFLQEDLWGVKKLAYEIKKKPRGYYVRFDYCGLGPVVDELERSCKIDDRVLKYLTVQLDAEADAEKILEEIAAANAPAPEPESASEPKPTAASDTPAPLPESAPEPEPAAASDAPAEDAVASAEQASKKGQETATEPESKEE